jgi:hypothetical protein
LWDFIHKPTLTTATILTQATTTPVQGLPGLPRYSHSMSDIDPEAAMSRTSTATEVELVES